MKTSVSSKGQIVLPAELRQQDLVAPGQQFEVERIKAGQYLLKRTAQPGMPGLLQWLQRCPVNDWFLPISSETTDTL
jgi:AbrB family looped-hinge helix DNA binding protein